jgi:hypothetical protein
MSVDRYVSNLIVTNNIVWQPSFANSAIGIIFQDGTTISTANLIATTAQ